jgi:5'-nucleotidase/UDP-sugar diphosphatase
MFARPSRLALLLATTVCLTGPAMAEFKLRILHTNDIHSRLEPINKQDSTCGEKDLAAGACFGGTARLATAIARERRPSSLLLDAGDQFQGSLFYAHYLGAEVAELMGKLGYDAMAVGNHEFDNGVPVLERFAKAIPFPLLMANADLAGEPGLAAEIAPFAVLTVEGEKIGVIGLTPQDNGELTGAGKSIRFGDPVEAVRKQVAALTAEGVNKIVLLSHSGYLVDQKIAASVDGVDVIVGGHSHTLLSNSVPTAGGPSPTLVAAPDGTKVPIVQTGSYGKYLGRLDVAFNDGGVVTEAVGEPILLDAGITEDAAIKARIAELAKPLEAVRNTVVGETKAPIEGSAAYCRTQQCTMGDLVADAMLDWVKDQGISIAITNGGGLRASIDGGPISMGEVLTVLPFQNTLATFTLKGAGIVAALENGVSQVESGGGRFPQVAGLEFDWSPSGEAGKSRIRAVRVMVDGKAVPIDPAADYRVVTNNFMRNGGDGYAAFAAGSDAYDFGPTLDSVLADYLGKAPFTPPTAVRIRLVP